LTGGWSVTSGVGVWLLKEGHTLLLDTHGDLKDVLHLSLSVLLGTSVGSGTLLEEGVVLAQNKDGVLHGTQCLDGVLLILVELLVFLLTDLGGLGKSLLVLCKLLLELLDGCGELGGLTGVLLDISNELIDTTVGLGNSLGLVLLVHLTPAVHLLGDVLVVCGLLRQCR